MNNNVCCIGAGYIGGPTMAVMALKNPQINFHVVDINQKRIDQWNSNDLPIYEPGLDEIVKSVRGKNLFFSTNIEEAVVVSDIIFIGVNTPTKTFGEGAGFASNLQYWESSAREISKYAKSNKIVVEKSTLPVKTADAIGKILNKSSKYSFTILSNPEFLAEGSAIKDLLNPDRVLIGGPETMNGYEAMETVANLYLSWVPSEKIIFSNVWSSELSKLASNAMLAQRVSSINSLAAICEETGAKIKEVANVVSRDSRIGSKFLVPGPGFGGSCFKKDILNMIYLCKCLGLEEVADYWHQVVLYNDYQQKRIVNRLLKNCFNTLSEKNITVLGYSFKANTGDVRETPARNIINMLLEEHANVTVYDPKALENAKLDFGDKIKYAENHIEAVTNAEIIVVATDWDEFKTYDWTEIYNNMKNEKLVYDTRNYLDHMYLKSLGFDVMATGVQKF